MSQKVTIIRVSPTLHSRVRVAAAVSNTTIQSVVEAALLAYLPPVKKERGK